MKKLLFILSMLVLTACAADSSEPELTHDTDVDVVDVDAGVVAPFEDYGDLSHDGGTDLQSHEQALTTQPWQPSVMFNEAFRGGNYYTGTTPSYFTQYLNTPNLEYQINGTVRSGDNTAFTHSYVTWSLTFAGTSNLCIQHGCTFFLCFENASRGWGICTQVYGQGANSWTMELHGTTAAFAGLKLGAYEFARWTMATTPSSYWPAPATITDFTVTGYN